MGGIVHNVSDVLVLIILFGVTIFVHELCHFVFALRCGMVIDVFSIGFGPPLWRRKIGGIWYKIGCIPFGGYVALPQLDPAGMEVIQGGDAEGDGTGGGDDAQSTRRLAPMSPWKKILVALSGALGNIVFAVVLAWIIFLSPEAETDSGDTSIGYVVTNSMAYSAGLRSGDEIVAVDGEKIETWHDYSVLCVLHGAGSNSVRLTLNTSNGVRTVEVPTSENEIGMQSVTGVLRAAACMISEVMPDSSADRAGLEAKDMIVRFDGQDVMSVEHFIGLVADRPGQAVPMTVERGGRLVEIEVVPRYDAGLGRALIGVQVGTVEVGTFPWMQYKKPMDQIKHDALGIVRILRALVTPRESKQAAKALGGPVMIIAWLWLSIKVSILNALGFLRFLNVNLAILNLLPFPVLDGGHIVFAGWELVTRRQAHPKVVNVLVNVFATLLIGALLVLTFRDVLRAPRMIKGFRDVLSSMGTPTNRPPADVAADSGNDGPP